MHADEEKWNRPGASGDSGVSDHAGGSGRQARPERRTPDPGMVIAARDGDARALDALLADALPLVYNIVGRALDGHADVDDVVQETLLRVVRGLNGLREPEAFRSWLVAIAVRQVRDREQERRKAFARSSALDTARDVPDPASDVVSAGLRSLSLADRRRVVTSAIRWLDADNRALLALWWLEELGELDRADLAASIGLSVRHTAVRVLRMKEQMQAACTVAEALRAEPRCPALREVTGDWDLEPNPLWRKRIVRHVRGCGTCLSVVGDLLPVDAMVRSLPLLPVPTALAQRWGGAAHGGLNGSTHAVDRSADRGGTARGTSRPARHARRLTVGRPRGGLLGGLAHSALAPVAIGAVVVGAAVGTVLAVQPSATPTAKPAMTVPAHSSTPAMPASPSASVSASVSAAASSSPSSSTARSSSSEPSSVSAPPPVVQAAPQRKKGVGVWTFSGVNTALAESKADWYYTWSTSHSGIVTPPGAGFVPMIWGPGSVTAANLAQAKAAGPYLLGFNEPDMASQSNMTVDQALSLWPQLMAAGGILGSPAVAAGAATPGGWLDRFMAGAQAKGYRVDFIALHWYGGDFTTADAVSQLRSYIQSVYDRYHKPIWLTEYALIDFSHGTAFPGDQQQAAFISASAQMLSALPYVQRYAWFALPAPDTGAGTGLFRSGPSVTPEGQAFEAAAGG